jgi:2-hydroxycyclohexanecarboxyl-CoA dehydrogenase
VTRLDGRVAVVTGGAKGIGAAIAAALIDAGAGVAVWDLGAPAGPASAALRLEVDVTNRAGVDQGVSEVEAALGPIDILVNNAGVDVIEPFAESREADWDRIIAVNLKGTFNCCHAVLPGMFARGRGAIVNLGSDAGKVGSSGEAVYSATKGGVIAFTKTLAREVASRGIRVNCVCPGPTDTALLGQVAEYSQKLYDSLARAIPMRRIARPDDVAPVVLFLAGDDAGYITGQAISVSGGLTMS